MTSKEFLLENKIFNRRKLTTLQHKLRVVLRCYTITEFILNEEDNSFSFKKSHMIRGVRMDDQKEYHGNYIYEQLGENLCKIRINVIGEKE